MKGLKFTEQTSSVAICLFTVYLIYGFLYIPVVEYFTCLAIGGISYAICESYEIAVLSILIGSFVFQFTRKRSEGFKSENISDSYDGPLVMEAPVAKKRDNVQGISSSYSEGFEDSNAASHVIDVKNDAVKNAEAPPVSAPAKPEDVLKQASTAPKISEQNIPAVTQPAESFEDNGGLFKLGKLPTDEKGGFHIDSGTSILNALKSLKPDQIASMTQDTKQLIDTQKSLMNMLQSFKPMMSEGKEMMSTFQEMFSPTSTSPGTVGGALGAAKIASSSTQ
jgi:hypothetical protein